MSRLSATVPISVVNGFLSGADRAAVVRLAERSGIPHDLLGEPAARVTQEQFSRLYRLLAMDLDDEMPGVFARPLRNGALKFLCLSLLDAPRLEVALHRFGQFFHLVLDEFQLVSRREGASAIVEFVANPQGPKASALAREIVLKLVHGVASWLIRQKIPLTEAAFEFLRPAQSGDLMYLFPGPVRFGCDRTLIAFDAAYLDRPVRPRKADLDAFLQRAPEDWIFASFSDELVSHQVRQCIADNLPKMPTVEAVAQKLHYSVRTLCRRLDAEGTSFQAIKDEVRRDIAIQRLTRSDDTISAIAFDVGFDNPTAFHRAFRHWTGSTPGAYRQRKLSAH